MRMHRAFSVDSGKWAERFAVAVSIPAASELLQLGGVFSELGYVLFHGTGLEQLFLIIVHLFLLSLFGLEPSL